MDIKLQRLESFSAQDTQGRAHKVYGYELLARAYPWLDPAVQWEPTGVVEYKLDTGEPLDLDRDGTLHGARSGLHLHRSPSAHSDKAH